MAAIRRRDIKPELRLRSALHAKGLRFRVDYRIDLAERRVRPDIAVTRRRVAVFVDGCFWHGCPDHGVRVDIQNEDYWRPKLTTTRQRDADAKMSLAAAGWSVVRVWEHEPLESAVASVLEDLGAAGEG